MHENDKPASLDIRIISEAFEILNQQAMDLVKSHLMFAVREEVEVLKEQIRDLAERNAALEQENGLLRALASPEQLAQLPSSGVPRLGPPAPNGPSV